MNEDGPQRAHTLIVSIGADTALDLAWELRQMADKIQRGDMTVGTIGGPSVGSMYSYRVLPEQTHNVYVQQVDEWLRRKASSKRGATYVHKQAPPVDWQLVADRYALIMVKAAHLAATIATAETGADRARIMSLSNMLKASLGRTQSCHGDQFDMRGEKLEC